MFPQYELDLKSFYTPCVPSPQCELYLTQVYSYMDPMLLHLITVIYNDQLGVERANLMQNRERERYSRNQV